VISQTESEVLKVLERIEAMLVCSDNALAGVSRFKQEIDMGHGKGIENGFKELDRVTHDMQDMLFELIQQLQFQDIVRQRLERALQHIIGMHNVISFGAT